MNATEKFENWFETEGIRTYADKDHGSADGHKWYMKQAFMQGYKMALDHCTEILLDPNNANIIED
jgi:hypothetical protein